MRPALVVDASAMTEVVVDGSGRGERARQILADFDAWMAPHLIDLECANGWRRAVRRGALSTEAFASAMADLSVLPIDRTPTHEFHERLGQLSTNLTPYDAAYVVLAEAYGVPLLTADARLTRAPGPRCEFILV